MRDLRNHTRTVIERAQVEAVTMTDGGFPIAVLQAITPNDGAWDVNAWLDQATGPDWEPYDSGLQGDLAAARRAAAVEPDTVEHLGLE